MFPQSPHQKQKKERPGELGDDLIRQCKEFMKVAVPASNIVFADEFGKYMPLFNKEMHDRAEPKEVDDLGREYASRFSMQHPIQILTRMVDPNGVFHPGDRKKYKLDRTVPAMFRRVSTLNDLGKKVPALMNAFFNATTSNANPFDQRKANYAKAIAEAVGAADKKEGKIEQQRAEFARASQALIKPQPKQAEKKKEEAQKESDESISGLIEWD